MEYFPLESEELLSGETKPAEVYYQEPQGLEVSEKNGSTKSKSHEGGGSGKKSKDGGRTLPPGWRRDVSVGGTSGWKMIDAQVGGLGSVAAHELYGSSGYAQANGLASDRSYLNGDR